MNASVTKTQISQHNNSKNTYTHNNNNAAPQINNLGKCPQANNRTQLNISSVGHQ